MWRSVFVGFVTNLAIKGKAKFLVSQVQIASMIEGRLRVIYTELKHDAVLRSQVHDELSQIKEITSFTINPTTGSVVINYDQGKAAQNQFLSELLLQAHAKWQKARA